MEPDELLNRRLKQTALALGWMLIAAGCLWALTRLWPAAQWLLRTLAPFLTALVVAYLFNPIVNVVQKKLRLGRVMGIVAVAVFIVVIVLGFFSLLVPVLYDQTARLVEAVRTYAPAAGKALSDGADSDVAKDSAQKLQAWMDENNLDLSAVGEKVKAALPGVAQGAAHALQKAVNSLGSVFSRITGFMASLALVLVIAFYYLVEFDAIPGFIRLLTPPHAEARTMELLGKVDRAVGGFLRGQLIVCALVAVLASLGLTAIGMKQYALLVGVIAGAANIVPYLGPAMGMAPGILWALLSPDHATWPSRLWFAGAIVFLFAMIQVLDGLVFQPRIVGKNSNLHPLLVILALAVGARFGLAGMVLAVPVACIARVLFLELWWTRHVEKRRAAE
jgi:predicted PurR-regulated permease PerM